jgi:carbonic anhydrase
VEVFGELVRANDAYVASGAHRDLPVEPQRRLAVITCMDARIAVFPTLGLELGDAHVLRTAGGRLTEDVLRSLTLSTHVLGARAVALVAHTRCGLKDPTGELVKRLTEVIGHPPWPRDWYAFADEGEAVREDCDRLLAWPDRPEGLAVAGYVLDVEDGRLHEVVPPTAAAPPPA